MERFKLAYRLEQLRQDLAEGRITREQHDAEARPLELQLRPPRHWRTAKARARWRRERSG